jgi:hypothetical protein
LKVIAEGKITPASADYYYRLTDGSVVVFQIWKPSQNRGSGHLAECYGAVYTRPNEKITLREPGITDFAFALTKGGIIPFGTQADTKYPFTSKCVNYTNSADRLGCAAWVIYNENMDYLHCDDLSWDGKTKCD